MSHVLTADRLRAETRRIPAELRIPIPPRGRGLATVRSEAWWREAMRWSLIGLTASWTAAELTLLMLGL